MLGGVCAEAKRRLTNKTSAAPLTTSIMPVGARYRLTVSLTVEKILLTIQSAGANFLA
jgi:hypothetical protein